MVSSISLYFKLLLDQNKLSHDQKEKFNNLLNVYKFKYKEDLSFDSFKRNKKEILNKIKFQIYFDKMKEWVNLFKIYNQEKYELQK